MSHTTPTDDRFEVDDPDRYVQQRRIKAILERRDAIPEARKNVLELRSLNRINAMTACRILKETVDGYIWESEQTIRDQLPGERYGLHIDPSEIDDGDLETAAHRAAYVAWFVAPLGSIEASGAEKSIEVRGLQQFLDLPHPVVFEYGQETTHPVRGRQTEQQTEQRAVPMDVSMQAYSILNSFWSTMNMDVVIERAGLDVEQEFDSLAENGVSISDHAPGL